MMKRLKNCNVDSSSNEDCQISLDDKILSSDIINSIPSTTVSNSFPYHTSLCGSILYSAPTNSVSDIFAYLRHGNFDGFRRSLDLYHNEIIHMRNEHGQTVLHVLVIHAYQYLWVRLLMMRGCDTCAQDDDGYTAAHYAVERDDVEMLKALTIRFHSQTKPISDEKITNIHQQCLKALTIREKQGLTVFMLACYRESTKCLNYLIELNINDSHLEDHSGDTCLHYVVARRNQNLIEKLINTCQANVNGGNRNRPSVLDLLQYNREQQKLSDQTKDDEIEQFLLSHNAKHRFTIRKIINKRKISIGNGENIDSNFASLSLDQATNGNIETARTHVRMAKSLQAKGELNGAKENYHQALNYLPNETLEWATYVYQLALIYINQEEKQIAFDLLQKSLNIRKQLEENSEEIEQIQTILQTISI